jgi:hypothetical protein
MGMEAEAGGMLLNPTRLGTLCSTLDWMESPTPNPRRWPQLENKADAH